MRKHELIALLAERADVTKREAEHLIDTLGTVITDALVEGKQVTIPGVGRLGTRVSASRTISNDIGTYEVPERITPRFQASATLKRVLANQPVS